MFQSDAKIDISDGPLSDPGDSKVTVTGTMDSVEKAISSLATTVYKVCRTVFDPRCTLVELHSY